MTDFWANTASRPTLFGQTVTTLEEGDMEPRSEAGEWQKEWPFDPILPSISEADEARESALALTYERAVKAIDSLDVIDGIVDDTHPEGDGCPLCHELDNLREVLDALIEEARRG